MPDNPFKAELVTGPDSDSVLDAAAAISAQPHVAAPIDQSSDLGPYPILSQPVSVYASIPGMVMAPYPTESNLTPAQQQIAKSYSGSGTTPTAQVPYGQKPDGTLYKKNELWPSDQPPGTSWLDVLLGVAKAAPGGIKTYYDIQTQSQLLRSSRTPKVRTAALPSVAGKSSSLTPWLIGGLALLVIGGGVFAATRGRSAPSTPAPTPKPSKRKGKK